MRNNLGNFRTGCSTTKFTDRRENRLLPKVERYQGMRTGGAILTVAGSILVVAGFVTYLNAWDDYNSDSAVTTAGVCVIAGYASLGAGIPLWIVGGVQHKKYSIKLRELSVKVNATPQSQGLTLTYRF